MADWILVPCLVTLRSDINVIAPGRDKSSDGSIGDTAHAAGGSSDHLPDEHFAKLRDKDTDAIPEVHAIDVDVDLRQPGLTMEIVVQRILARCRSGAERRLRYIIYNRRIWEASNGWRQRAYTGANPHDHHAHFSASYDTAHEADTSNWGLRSLIQQEDFMDAADKAYFDAKFAALAGGVPTAAENATAVHDRPVIAGGKNYGFFYNLTARGDDRSAYLYGTFAPAVLGALQAILANVQADDGDKAQLLAAISAAGVDEQAIVTGVLAGLDPAAIAAAIPSDIAEQVADELRDRLTA